MDSGAKPIRPPRLALRRGGGSDERLVAAVRRGDPAAFEAVYDRYHRALLAFCRHMLGTREDAEDALQQVFVSAHAGLRADDRPIALKAWLYTIARNRCLSVLRGRRDSVALGPELEPSTDGLAVADAVERRQELKDMLADLARLPHEQREALVLAELDDLSHEEIAGVLGVPRAKVKALIFQARETLAGYRSARGADCAEIREQLATASGAALRRGALQRHVAVCPGCAAFREEVGRQRAALALVLPVIPSLALKHSALSAASSAATVGAGAAAGSSALVAGSSTLAAKALVVVAIAAGTGGGAVAVHELASPGPPARPASEQAVRGPAAPAGLAGTSIATAAGGRAVGAATPGSRRRAAARKRAGAARGHSGDAHGRSAEAPGHTRILPGRRLGTTKPKHKHKHKHKAHGRSADAPGQVRAKVTAPPAATPRPAHSTVPPVAPARSAPRTVKTPTAPKAADVPAVLDDAAAVAPGKSGGRAPGH